MVQVQVAKVDVHLPLKVSDNHKEAEVTSLPSAVDKVEDDEGRKKALIREALKLESDIESAKQKLNNDQKYIRLLHEYNYLKVSTLAHLIQFSDRMPPLNLWDL